MKQANGPFFDLGLTMSGPWQVKGNWGTDYVDVPYTYRLTNAGPDAIAPVITDNVCSPVTYWYGDTDGDAMIDPGDEPVDAGEILAVGIDVVPAIDSRLSLVDRAAGDHLADDLGYDVIQTHPSHPGPPV